VGLKIDLKIGEVVDIEGGRIRIKLIEKSGQRASLEFIADKSISIERRKSPAHFALRGINLKPA
jgi:hypothetical protein